MREVIEEILTHAGSVDPAALASIHRYTKLFWINTGPFNNLTARKFVLDITPEAFAAAARAAEAEGARFPTRDGETLDELLARLEPLFFDEDDDPIVTNKTPAAGDDMLLSSANNLYDGVSLADLEGFDERYALNSRLVKHDGLLEEEVYRIDDGGRYAAELGEVVRHLEAAIPYATEPDGRRHRGARHVVSHRRAGGPARLRHRVGGRQGVARRHDQRLHRGLHGRARRERRVGGARLLRQRGEDGGNPHPGRARAVVRGSHAVGPALPQGGGARHHRQRDRCRHRDRRRRSGDADRHQPAERIRRSGNSTAASPSRCRT